MFANPSWWTWRKVTQMALDRLAFIVIISLQIVTLVAILALK